MTIRERKIQLKGENKTARSPTRRERESKDKISTNVKKKIKYLRQKKNYYQSTI